ncbi:c-type cytochrome [Dechloromonas sp. A34]|uniref:c-type cytochrome n=1 Tax=Dechloromonas sp. A34 TaxID=447588 RepID=UPI002248ED00|nr:c-type cytochrome [Dechloromonas sp. A34]
MKFRQILISLLCLAGAPALAADAAALVEQHCSRCHGSDGLATGPGLPHLNGQLEAYLADAIGKLQKGRLPTTVATHIPAELSSSDLAVIAGHYAGIRAIRPKQEVDPAKQARGEEVYRNRCAECHPDNGREADKDAPLMAAQSLDYMLAQTRLFVSGKRKFGFLQDEAFKGLSSDDLDAAAHFFASQEQYAEAKPVIKKKQRR